MQNVKRQRYVLEKQEPDAARGREVKKIPGAPSAKRRVSICEPMTDHDDVREICGIEVEAMDCWL